MGGEPGRGLGREAATRRSSGASLKVPRSSAAPRRRRWEGGGQSAQLWFSLAFLSSLNLLQAVAQGAGICLSGKQRLLSVFGPG